MTTDDNNDNNDDNVAEERFWSAIGRQDVATVQALVVQGGGVPVDTLSSNGDTALMVVAGEAPLTSATSTSSDNKDDNHCPPPSSLLSKLLDWGADPNFGDDEGYTPLMMACQEGHLANVRQLVEHAASHEPLQLLLNQQRHDGTPALYVAMESGHLDIVEYLLQQQPSLDLLVECNDGYPSALYLAASLGRLDMINLLIGHSVQQQEPPKWRHRLLETPSTADGSTPLYIASQLGHATVVERLLELRANASTTTHAPSLQSPLYIACCNGHVDCVTLLYQHFVRQRQQQFQQLQGEQQQQYSAANVLDQVTGNGTTPLFMACQNGHFEICQILLQTFERQSNHRTGPPSFRADPNIVDAETGASPLLAALQKQHGDICRLLLSCPDTDAGLCLTESGLTPLILAAELGWDEAVRQLVPRPEVNLNAADAHGATALYMACQNDCVETCRILLLEHHPEAQSQQNPSRRIDLNAGHSPGPGQPVATPLYVAAQLGHEDIVALLIEHGAAAEWCTASSSSLLSDNSTTDEMDGGQVSQEDHKRQRPAPRLSSPLYVAAQNGHVSIVQRLLQAGVSPRRSRGDGDISPLQIACQQGHLEICQLLLPAEGNFTDHYALASPLHMAVAGNHEAIVQLLVSYDDEQLQQQHSSSMLHSRDQNQKSPLHVAVERGNVPIARCLLQAMERHQNSNESSSSSTMLEQLCSIAEQQGNDEMIQLLREYFQQTS